MESADGLAAYLAGELSDTERIGLERQLLVDTRLRAQLDAMRTADFALGALRSPQPSPDFSRRLHEQLAVALGNLLPSEHPTDTSSATAVASGDTNWSPTAASHPPRRVAKRHQASRDMARPGRSRPHRPRQHWAPALAGVAAGIAGLFGLGVVARDLVVPPGDEVMVAMDTAIAESFDGENLGAARSDALTAPPGAPLLTGATGPVIASLGRGLDAAQLHALVELPALHDLVARDWAFEDPVELATSWNDALRAHLTVGRPDPQAPVAPDAAGGVVVTTSTTVPLTADDVRALERCLAAAIGSDDVVIPAYLELAVDQQFRPVVVAALIVVEADGTGNAARQVRVLDRATCEVVDQFEG